MTQQITILGYPLAHTISPAFQQAALDHYSLSVRYTAWPTPPDSLSDAVKKLRRDEYLGANVTIPHKERIVALLDGTDGLAATLRAVNTVVKEDQKLAGRNTDVGGFLRSLKEADFEPRDRSVLLLGAGGAARAAAFGLAQEGVAALTIANRTQERARRLVEELRHSAARIEAIPMEETALAAASAGADLIVNATSIGMSHGADQDSTPLGRNLIPPSALVCDMVYTPSETPLMREARAAGARTLGGLPMLIYQGAASFELWTGRDAPIEVMFRAAEEALASQTA